VFDGSTALAVMRRQTRQDQQLDLSVRLTLGLRLRMLNQ
jgi:hypothetical protein